VADPWIALATNIGVLSFVALSAYLVLLSGEISFGQQAFFGVGAYAAGLATAMAGWPLAAGLVVAAVVGGLFAALLAVSTLRLTGLYFAMATLAFAEVMRIALELVRWRTVVDGVEVGPDGVDGFRDIRAVFEADMSAASYMALVWGLLLALVAGLTLLEGTRPGRALRRAGEDEVLAAHTGVPVLRVRLAAITAAGAIAGLGGGLYAHLLTYVEPRNFDIMLGVHSLAYGLIGGLGTPFGPLLGVVIDIGLLESTRLFTGYRMIVFAALVAVLLIVRPRGLLDERTVHRIGAAGRALRGRLRRARD
jgi:branched-chain amino acid transport system permease protein